MKFATKHVEPEQNLTYGWATPPGMELFVRAVADLRQKVPSPSERNHTVEWSLHYYFAPFKFRVAGGPWRNYDGRAAYLFPRYRDWYMAPMHRRTREWRFCWINFLTEDSVNLHDDTGDGTRKDLVCFKDPDGVIAGRMMEAAATGRALEHSGYWAVHGIVWNLLQILIKARHREDGTCEIRASDVGRNVDPVITRGMAYLNEHLAEPIKIAELARHLGMAESTLAHRFRKGSKESPIQALHRLRILRAKALMVQGFTLDTVAEATGFCDRRHLTRIFRKVEGSSPQEFLSASPQPVAKPIWTASRQITH